MGGRTEFASLPGLLKVALAQMNGTHPKATVNIEAAIREIRIALKLK
jgi:hypothetical protein